MIPKSVERMINEVKDDQLKDFKDPVRRILHQEIQTIMTWTYLVASYYIKGRSGSEYKVKHAKVWNMREKVARRRRRVEKRRRTAQLWAAPAVRRVWSRGLGAVLGLTQPQARRRHVHRGGPEMSRTRRGATRTRRPRPASSNPPRVVLQAARSLGRCLLPPTCSHPPPLCRTLCTGY